MTTLKSIALEWDRNAISRCRQIDEGKDFSHDQVLVPSILRLAGNLHRQVVLDVGCGCGFLTAKAARRAKAVVGIDISQEMIRQARLRHAKFNLSFRHISLEALARTERHRYDTCISNMSVITMPNLMRALRALSLVTKVGGVLVFSISHPCFWNTYRQDEKSSKFNYWQSHRVIAPCRITLDKKPLPKYTTYFHRPLGSYFSCLNHVGFQVEDFVEPRPPRNVPELYRKAFTLPRFAVFRARKS